MVTIMASVYAFTLHCENPSQSSSYFFLLGGEVDEYTHCIIQMSILKCSHILLPDGWVKPFFQLASYITKFREALSVELITFV